MEYSTWVRWTAALQIAQPAPFPNPLWQRRLRMDCKSWASWLHTNQVNTVLKIFIIVQLPGTHTCRHISGNWQPSKTFVWLLILPQKRLWDRAVCRILDQAPLSRSSCQFTFQIAILSQMSVQFTVVINEWIGSLLYRQKELMCYARQMNYYEPVSYSFWPLFYSAFIYVDTHTFISIHMGCELRMLQASVNQQL